jgi:conjugal transfer pilus assembly protein TraB
MSEEDKDGGLFADTQPPKASGSEGRKDVKKRWLLVGGGVLVFAMAVSSLMSSKAPAPPKREEAPQLINLTPKDVDQRAWQVRSQEDIQGLKNENDKLRAELNGLHSELEKLKLSTSQAALPPNIVPPPVRGNTGTPPLVQPTVVPPPPLPTSASAEHAGVSKSLPAVPPPFTSEADAPPAEPLVFKPEKTALTSPNAGPELEAKVRYKRNTQSGMMVAGAFAPVVLLNGLDAGTSSGSRSNPEPVLMRVQDHAVLPGSAKYQLRSCFLLGSGYGELSAERVYIRLARLSCVDNSDRLVLSVPVQGYVVDSDNTLGMRGKVVDRQGARLGKAMLAGFAQGLSSALGGAQGTVTSSVLGAATSVTGTEALRASGLTGASTAAGQLATFYLKEAQSIFPVITVQGGRTAMVVFTEDANLAWGAVDAQFVREVDPQGSAHGS